jgi:2-oxoglutarate ferredoxin oxidoreductase subunit alpha
MIEDGATRNRQNEKRLRKLNGMKREITAPEYRKADGGDITLIGWGSTRGAIREAAALLKEEGMPVNTLHISQLWPFPADRVAGVIKNSRKCVVVEGNATAQLAQLIRRETGLEADATILRYDGRPHTPADIADRLRKEVSQW